ncbi:hypothetical protein [Paenibacillus sp. L3-i20]|uniref:hypothetical protein n=1 Tax=Paenibacillus sp. L3-i20 TaxID=2905833 RepID=UPI0020BE439E|nr:hypothetical protein [Paenibacillus sp. L3-i20]
MSYWVGNQNFTSIPFLQVLGAATITGLLITVKLSLDPIVAPWIGKLNDRSTTGNRFVVLLTIVASTLLILFPLKMNIVIWLSLTILLLLLSTTLMNLNDAKIFLYATGQHRHSVISTYSMTSDLGAAVGPLLGFSFISFFGDLGTAWMTALLLITCSLSGTVIKRAFDRKRVVKINTML